MFCYGQKVKVRVTRNRCKSPTCSTCKSMSEFYEGEAVISADNETSFGISLSDGSFEVISIDYHYKNRYPDDYIKAI